MSINVIRSLTSHTITSLFKVESRHYVALIS